MHVTCEKCVYWESPKADTEERLGECRRNPPVHEFWPVTLPDDWCGQAMPNVHQGTGTGTGTITTNLSAELGAEV